MRHIDNFNGYLWVEVPAFIPVTNFFNDFRNYCKLCIESPSVEIYKIGISNFDTPFSPISTEKITWFPIKVMLQLYQLTLKNKWDLNYYKIPADSSVISTSHAEFKFILCYNKSQYLLRLYVITIRTKNETY